MQTRFGDYSWQPTGVFCTPTLIKSYTSGFLLARARRGRGSAQQSALMRPSLLQRLAREEEDDMEEEETESLTSFDDLHL